MANSVLGKSLCSDWFFLSQDFAVWTVSMEMVQPVYFCFGVKPANQNLHFTIRNRVPYNKQPTNRASSGHTGKYWPSVVAVQTLLRSVRTATTSGQYSSVQPLRSVSKQLILAQVFVFLFLSYQLMQSPR